MLKKISGLFLGLVVLAGSACVTPTHASSASGVMVTYIQAAGGGAKEELVVIYNASSADVDITQWCLFNKANVPFACFDDEQVEAYELPAYSYATIASYEYADSRNYPDDFYSLLYDVTNQSSGSIVGSADTISLVDADGNVVSSKSWTSSFGANKGLGRIKIMTNPDMYASNNESSDWAIVPQVEPPISSLTWREAPDTPGGNDTSGGETGSEDDDGGGTVEDGDNVPAYHPLITELLPNPVGSDAGAEFIEFYNPDPTQALSLAGYAVRIGFDKPKWVTLPVDILIPPRQYVAIFNETVSFSLTNTTGRVQLYNGDNPVGEPIEYSVAKDDWAWALFDGVWQYIRPATPGVANSVAPTEKKPSGSTIKVPKPCASNQYRNPATNRCKRIATAGSTSKPCKVGQVRNPATNRCRSATAKASGLTPCKANQVRNPETNRCKSVPKMSNANYKVQGVQTGKDNQPSWYYIVAIVGIVAAVVGYAVWEWRSELYGLWKWTGGKVKRWLRASE